MNNLSSSQHVSFFDKLVFWLLLSALSTALAEVVANSCPFPFFSAWGLLLVTPVYSLHVLVLSCIVFRKNRACMATLFLAGAIFGMYEAYLTKVLWSPTWGEDWPCRLGGIHLIQTAILVLFWHPFMAYILPVFLAENLFTDSSETFRSLPDRLQKMIRGKRGWLICVILSAVYFGAVKSFSSTDVFMTLLSALSNVIFIFALGWFWLGIKAGRNLTFRDVLPSFRQACVLAVFLAILYILYGLFLRPEALPRTPGPHVAIWSIYAVLFMLLHLNIRRSPPPADASALSPIRAFGVRTGLLFMIIFPLVSVTLIQAKYFTLPVVIGMWAAGCTAGAAILVYSARVLFRRKAG